MLEVLRQPLEEGAVRIARAARTAAFPARFMLIGAMNPCPCGYPATPARVPLHAAAGRPLRARLSGPLRDRIDLIVEVSRPAPRELQRGRWGSVSRDPATAW